MKAILMMLKKKWIDGECRKLCCVCPYWKRYCQVVYLPASRYAKGYAQGFEDGYSSAKKYYNK